MATAEQIALAQQNQRDINSAIKLLRKAKSGVNPHISQQPPGVQRQFKALQGLQEFERRKAQEKADAQLQAALTERERQAVITEQQQSRVRQAPTPERKPISAPPAQTLKPSGEGRDFVQGTVRPGVQEQKQKSFFSKFSFLNPLFLIKNRRVLSQAALGRLGGSDILQPGDTGKPQDVRFTSPAKSVIFATHFGSGQDTLKGAAARAGIQPESTTKFGGVASDFSDDVTRVRTGSQTTIRGKEFGGLSDDLIKQGDDVSASVGRGVSIQKTKGGVRVTDFTRVGSTKKLGTTDVIGTKGIVKGVAETKHPFITSGAVTKQGATKTIFSGINAPPPIKAPGKGVITSNQVSGVLFRESDSVVTFVGKTGFGKTIRPGDVNILGVIGKAGSGGTSSAGSTGVSTITRTSLSLKTSSKAVEQVAGQIGISKTLFDVKAVQGLKFAPVATGAKASGIAIQKSITNREKFLFKAPAITTTKTRIKPLTVSTSFVDVVPKQKLQPTTTTRTIFFPTTTPTTIQTPTTTTRTIPTTIQTPTQIQSPTTQITQITAPAIPKTITSPPTPQPPIQPGIPFLPLLRFPSFELSEPPGLKKIGGKQRFGDIPSFSAFAFNIRGAKAQPQFRGRFSGFEVRPIFKKFKGFF